MGMTSEITDPGIGEKQESAVGPGEANTSKQLGWRRFFGGTKLELSSAAVSSDGYEEVKMRPEKWSLGVLNDKETEEVPGM